jgi:hypothetical protein
MFANEKNRVIIRVWHSAFNLSAKGVSCGHVSIEISEIKVCEQGCKHACNHEKVPFYVSLWPLAAGKKTGLLGAYKTMPHELKSNYEVDLKEEGRLPETIICLYSLKTINIVNKFNAIKSTLKGWTLFGSNKILNSGNAESCASLAYRLLNAGNIYSLAPSVSSAKFSSTATPDDLATLVKTAKKKELKKYPKTKHFNFSKETKPREKCILM